uniref:Uncharacterized protein n=1 Tax=Brassica oleracea var. oleracea TaxID=109376 RepID=A0A0D3DRY9_BRAOL
MKIVGPDSDEENTTGAEALQSDYVFDKTSGAVHFPTQNFACTRFCDKLMQEIPEVKQATARFNDFFIGWFGENPETMKTIVGSKITRFYRG